MSGADASSTHGHVILRWLAEQPMAEDALGERVVRELGAGMRFHTCDTRDLSLDALIRLLAARGKIVRAPGGWRSEMSRVCSDE